MCPEITLTFNGGYIRALKTGDVHADYVSGLNDQQVNRYLEVRHVVQTEESVINFVQHNQQAKNEVLFGIWRDEKNLHCGTLRLHGIEYTTGKAHIGVCIFDKNAWGYRLGSQAITLVTKWAIDHLNLQWIEAGIYRENIASQKAFLSAGYDWVSDVSGKYSLDGNPTVIKIYAKRKVKD